jgi:HlyD family secretion protein
MTQNVVTYTVEILTDNSSGKLLPYLTANLNFELDRRHNVLLVPKAALSWSPQPQLVVPEFRTATGESNGNGDHPENQPSSRKTARSAVEGRHAGVVWVPQGNLVRPVAVEIGLSDGAQTEISGDALQEGQPVIIGEKRAASAETAAANPFTPQLRRRSPAKP